MLGARYTRARRPVSLVYKEVMNTRAEAARREYELKLLRRKEKLALIKNLSDLSSSS
jgi:putative endonuclease